MPLTFFNDCSLPALPPTPFAVSRRKRPAADAGAETSPTKLFCGESRVLCSDVPGGLFLPTEVPRGFHKAWNHDCFEALLTRRLIFQKPGSPLVAVNAAEDCEDHDYPTLLSGAACCMIYAPYGDIRSDLMSHIESNGHDDRDPLRFCICTTDDGWPAVKGLLRGRHVDIIVHSVGRIVHWSSRFTMEERSCTIPPSPWTFVMAHALMSAMVFDPRGRSAVDSLVDLLEGALEPIVSRRAGPALDRCSWGKTLCAAAEKIPREPCGNPPRTLTVKQLDDWYAVTKTVIQSPGFEPAQRGVATGWAKSEQNTDRVTAWFAGFPCTEDPLVLRRLPVLWGRPRPGAPEEEEVLGLADELEWYYN